jgi:xanthine dehydrogenase accessory factor
MSTDLQFYQNLAEALTQGPVAIATVIHTIGSVPREVGARLMLRADGHTLGTIGGGAGEANVLQQAHTVLVTGHKQLVNIDLSGAAHRDTQGVCGGQMRVWLERWQGDTAIAIARRIVHQLHQGQPIQLITPLSQDHGPTLAAVHDGSTPAPATIDACFQETLQPQPVLLIVGAGHCGIQLAKVAHLVGFRIMVQDDRPTWANPLNFPEAERLFHGPLTAVMEVLDGYHQLYAALVTRGIDYDLPALKALLNRHLPCAYIGMIGSQKRVSRVLEAVRAEGVEPAQLQALYAPIGLDLGALTPEEIAVSICSELILHRRGGSGQPLSLATRMALKLNR